MLGAFDKEKCPMGSPPEDFGYSEKRAFISLSKMTVAKPEAERVLACTAERCVYSSSLPDWVSCPVLGTTIVS